MTLVRRNNYLGAAGGGGLGFITNAAKTKTTILYESRPGQCIFSSLILMRESQVQLFMLSGLRVFFF